MITASALAGLVYIAVGLGTLIPIVLLIMLYVDIKRGNLW